MDAARAFVAENRAVFGLAAADVGSLEVTRNHRLADLDVTIVNLTQTSARRDFIHS